MRRGKPTSEVIRLRIITLLNSAAYLNREITLVIIAKRIGCTPTYVQNVRNSLK